MFVTDDSIENFDIPTEFDFRQYKRIPPAVAKEYFRETDSQDVIAVFKTSFTTGLLTERAGKSFFSKKKVNDLCKAHNLRQFRLTVGDFFRALLSAVR